MRSGPISDTFAGVFATLPTNSYSSSGTLRASRSRSLAGRRCDIAVPAWCSSRNVPALAGRRAFDPALVGLQRRARGVETFDRRAETVLEIEPPHLAVGDDVEAGALLQPYRAAHGLVLDGAECLRRQLTFVEARALFLQPRWPQQAADHVGADGLQIGHGRCPGVIGGTLHQCRKCAKRGSAAPHPAPGAAGAGAVVAAGRGCPLGPASRRSPDSACAIRAETPPACRPPRSSGRSRGTRCRRCRPAR